jgi:hypothetical protein
MAVDLIHRLDKRSEKQIQKEWLANLERVEGKMQILSRVAEAVVGEPDGIVRNVLFPRVKEETFNNLVAEFRLKSPQLRLLRQTVMQQKFARHYRRMLPTLLETLQFRSDNRFQPIIEALEVIRRHIRLHAEHFPTGEKIPLDGIVTPKWREKVLGEGEDEPRVNRRYYELCVLEKLEKALKCKEVWVEGSYAFRNPNQDLPGDWNDETCRALHYSDLGKPQDAGTFITSLKQRLAGALEQFNRVIPALPHLRIFRPNKKEDRGLWALAKLEPQPEPESLGLIKSEINDRYGMLDLLDVFVEADRMVDFTRFFAHSGTKEMRSRDALRPLLILDLFAEGTNTGIKPALLQTAGASGQTYTPNNLLKNRTSSATPDRSRMHCNLRIMRMTSIPLSVAYAVLADLKPSMERMRRLIAP